MDAKELVQEYYKAAAARDHQVIEELIDNDLQLKWHSSKGYLELDKSDFMALAAEMRKSYSSSRLDVSHMIAEGNAVTVRYTHYVNAFENPNEEMVLGHFVVIWEVENDKIIKGFLMSQLG